jgi:hypothetical protein
MYLNSYFMSITLLLHFEVQLNHAVYENNRCLFWKRCNYVNTLYKNVVFSAKSRGTHDDHCTLYAV